MASDLPDIDQSLSFVVDGEEAIGPIALSEIAHSISAGERPPDAFVWWEGEAEWVPFNSDVRLVLLLREQVGTGHEDALDETAGEDAVDNEVVAEDAEAARSAFRLNFQNAEPTQLVEESSPEEVDEPLASFMEPAVIEVAEEPEPVVIEMAAEEPLTTEDDVPAEAAEPAMIDLADEDLTVEEAVEDTAIELVEVEAVEVEQIEIEEVIDARTFAVAGSVADLEQIEVAENSVLASVGARLEALASATRHSRTSTQLDRAGASPVENPVLPAEVDLRASEPEPPLSVEYYEDASPAWSSTLENQFDAMVRHTVDHQRHAEQSERVRELLARACAASISRQGYSVDRRSELRGHYYLGFESGADTRRMRLEITPTTSVGGVSAQNVHIVMSWGRMAFDIEEALEVVQSQLPVADRQAGTISADAELDTGSVSTRVELIWAIDSFVGDDYAIDRDALELALSSTQHALEKRWYELFIPAE